MISKAKYFALAAMILLSDFHVLTPSLRMPAFAGLLLLGLLAMTRGIPLELAERERPMLRLLVAACSFAAYMALVDLIRGASFYSVFVQFSAHAFVISMLPAFYDGGREFPLVRHFRTFVLISVGFALLQVSGGHFALADLVPNLGLVGVSKPRDWLIDSYGRATGATYNTIAYAIETVLLCLASFWALRERFTRPLLITGVLALLGLLASQTRAALLAASMALLLTHLVVGRQRWSAIITLIPLVIAALGAYVLLETFALDQLPYLFKEVSISDTHRLWVNWYMSIGVLNESPLFGIAPDVAWDLYLRWGDLSIVAYDPETATPTHHNQFGFYLRYYGLVGLTWLLLIYALAFKSALDSPTLFARRLLFSCILADLIYSMTHNNKLLGSPLLWAMMAMAYQSRRPIATGTREHPRAA